MGEVYRAVRADKQFQKTVAIKMVRLDTSSELAVHRFGLERQILANLDHPNIAGLLDAGRSDSGRPYLVMEYVEGTSLSCYCRDHKLSVNDRIKLLRQVCAAVQYAHQMLVIHRDIKPGNILVTSDGVPKLLDFGIAKLMDSGVSQQGGTTQTLTGIRMMSPDYASPEQVLGQPITTATDVYSLGAVLYELLTGQRPHDLKTYDPLEVARVVCEQPLKAPSSAGDKTLRGDLDTIILKAMHREPVRRYGSVEQFSEDLRRYLEGQPVLARNDTLFYRADKYVRRHRWAVSVAAVAVLAISAGYIAERRQAHLAAERFEIVRGLARKLIFDVHDEVARMPGSTKPREVIVATALDYLDKLSRTASDDPVLLSELAQGYFKVGSAQGAPAEANLGRTEAAFASFEKAQSLYERAAALDPKYRLPLAELLFSESYMRKVIGDSKNADEAMTKGLTIAEAFYKSQPTNKQALQMLAVANASVGDGKEDSDSQAALAAYRRCRDYQAALTNLDPSDPNRMRLFRAHLRVGSAAANSAELDESLANLNEAAKIIDGLSREQPNNPVYLRGLALLYQDLTFLSETDERPSRGDTAHAIEYARKYVGVNETAMAKDPNDVTAEFSLSMALIRLSSALRLTDTSESLATAKRALSLIDDNLKRSPDNFLTISRRARVLRRLSEASLAAGNLKAARDSAIESLAVTRTVVAKSPNDLDERRCLLLALAVLGDALAASGDQKGALQRYNEGVEIARSLLQIQPHELLFVIPTSRVYTSLARASPPWRKANIDLWANCNQANPYVQRRLHEVLK